MEDMRTIDVDNSTDVHCYVVFSPTVHFVEYGTLMGVAKFQGKLNVTLMSKDRDRTNITCIGKSARAALVFDGLDSIVITNLTFTGCYAQENGLPTFSVVSVINSRKLIVNSCRFFENEGTGIGIQNVYDSVKLSHCKFIGSNVSTSAGVQISLDHHLPSTSYAVVITIEFCHFLNLNDKRIIQTDICFGNGTGICLLGNLTTYRYPVNISIFSSVFDNNIAANGAGVYINVDSSPDDFHVLIDKCVFSNCRTQSNVYVEHQGHIPKQGFGGAIVLLMYGESKGTIAINNSLLDSNYANVGAAIAVFFLENSTKIHVTVASSNFTNNLAKLGGALSLTSIMKTGQWPVTTLLRDASFVGNKVLKGGKGSALVTLQADVSLTGVTKVKSNNGSAFLIIGHTWVIVSDSVTFSDNHGLQGGAMYLNKRSAIRFHKGATLTFENNTAYSGGALFVHNMGVSREWLLLGTTARNYYCFITPFSIDSQDNFFPSKQKHLKATIKFVNNKADVVGRGGAIYAYSLDVCAWQEGSGLNFTHALRSSSFLYVNNWPNDMRSQMVAINATLEADTMDHKTKHHLLNSDTRCSDNRNVYCITPGISYILKARGQDSLGYDVSGAVIVRTNTTNINISRYHHLLTHPEGQTQEFQFTAGIGWASLHVTGSPNTTAEILVRPQMSSFQQVFIVRLINCFAGFRYDSKSRTCKCDIGKGKHNHIRECRYYGEVRVQAGFWIGHITTDGPLVSYSCPVGYCSCHSDSCWFDPRVRPDRQCTKGRDGTLCGKCAENYSATFGSLYSKCEPNCKNEYKWELPLLGLVSAFVVVAAVLFNLNVAAGVFRSFVFYFQMVGFTLNAVAPGGILSQKWVAYFAGIANLNIREGICMWENMTPLHSTVLQYFMPTCIFVCMAIFVILARKFPRMARIPVLRAFWSLLTLTYVSISYTTFILLQCVPLEDGDDYYWYGDATVRCFTGQHTKFAITAIIIAIFYVIPFPFFVAFGLPWITKLKPVSDISLQAFKGQYWWGEGWNFGRRLLLIVIHCFSGEPHLHQTLMIIFISAFLAFHGQLQPYFRIRDNIVETCLLFNLVVVNALQMHTFRTPVPSYITETLFLVPYAAACFWFLFYAWQRYGKKGGNEERKSKTPHGKKSSHNTDSGSQEMQPLNMTNGGKSNPSISLDKDQIMDESNDALREPLLILTCN
ncbi:uncharacterized protein LOC134183614 [Corticium candelabrum]|uniref:uncharacterized protein LOC134183614 n=1 Tax=Corticium candelabrum TaxID=121492 RepID=UPI002E25A4FF|nr:uncharacterized protein LOC134183614 [Corticium candelabrum]